MTLQAATSKSACIDIPSPYDMELIELYNPHKIPTGYYGLIPPGTVGLILGRSSCTMKGLVVLTGARRERPRRGFGRRAVGREGRLPRGAWAAPRGRVTGSGERAWECEDPGSSRGR